MPPLWRLEEDLELTDEHPSGLFWVNKGKFVTRLNKVTGYYEVSLDGEMYLAHRIVYYMRTGKCPDKHAVKHHHYNKDKDNRKDLMPCYQPQKNVRKSSWSWD